VKNWRLMQVVKLMLRAMACSASWWPHMKSKPRKGGRHSRSSSTSSSAVLARCSATLEAQGVRHITLDAQRFAPGRQEEGVQLYPVHFCRDCGQEYLPVWQSKQSPASYAPREIDDITADDNEDVYYGFLCPAGSGLTYRGDIEDLPETWLDLSRDPPKIKQNYKKAVPYSVSVEPCKETRGVVSRSGTSRESFASA
jgi:hypothetical protein